MDLWALIFTRKQPESWAPEKIGLAMARICRGFGMRVIAYDRYPNNQLDFLEYVSLDQLLSTSDLISLH